MSARHPHPAPARHTGATDGNPSVQPPAGQPAAGPAVLDTPRGLVLHVLLSEDAAQVTGTELAEVAELLRETAEELLPAAATYTTLSLGSR